MTRPSRDFPIRASARPTLRIHNLPYEPPDEFRWRGMIDVLTQQRHCFWCGVRVHVPAAGKFLPDDATREHLIPHCYGGGSAHNLVIACRRCNGNRGSDVNWQPHPRHITREARRVLQMLRAAAHKRAPVSASK